VSEQLPTTRPSLGPTDFGKLHVTFNNDPKFGSSIKYHRVLVKAGGQFETLLLTDSELERIRGRSDSNPEELLEPTWVDKLRAL